MTLEEYAAFYEALEPDQLDRLGEVFAPTARFRDPFNDVTGPGAIRRVFEHMYRVCEQPEFRVLEVVPGTPAGYLRWEFRFGGRRRRVIEGVSRVRLGADGRVEEHLDYWDPAAGIYETLPLVGAVLRGLRRRLSA